MQATQLGEPAQAAGAEAQMNESGGAPSGGGGGFSAGTGGHCGVYVTSGGIPD